MQHILRFIFLFPLFSATLSAYTGNVEKQSGITITIQKIGTVTSYDTPFDAAVAVQNDSDQHIDLTLSASSIETVEVTGESKKDIAVSAKSATTLFFSFVCKQGTYSAHYPIRIAAEGKLGGKEIKLRPVQVVETDFSAVRSATLPDKLSPLAVSGQGGLSLYSVNNYQFYWNYDGKETVNSPLGWQGNDPVSSATFFKANHNEQKAFSVHPPWRGGVGNMGVEYRLKLPDEKPIILSFYGAIRETAPNEPASDGVTYRIRVNNQTVQEKHLVSKTWTLIEADLSTFAGQTISLYLETDPGAQRNTTCDGAFWGTPIIRSGIRPAILTAGEKQKLFAKNLAALQSGTPTDTQTVVYPFQEGLSAVITFGRCGFIDGVIGLGNADSFVQYDGMNVLLKNEPLGLAQSTLHWGEWKSQPSSDPKIRQFEQDVWQNNQKFKLTYTIKANGSALQLGVKCDDSAAISKIAFGPTNQKANRVYFGHGYCIEEPKQFSVAGGGHALSTSHAGFDFDGGLSVLMATTTPPDHLIVNPETKTYTLTTYPDSMLTLMPGIRGAMEIAIRYRPLYDKKPSAGVKNKAGRMVFDVWGGQFTKHTKLLKMQADYGITDTIFVNHNWQRWGYDNRLPDIFPPNKQLGTLDEMKETLELCKKHGILYTLHDNYIDIYPDCDGFNFDRVSFEENGKPRKAWNNYGIEAQSYQFRPDTILPTLDRNFGLIMPDLPPTAYFVDVFSSINIMDFYDRTGNFHSRTETLDYWNQAFDKIRDHLGNDLPTISEAGSDFLIGHLDGADCQFMLIDDEQREFRLQVPCKRWSRIPWFDMVNHTRFSLHGVGYDSRYASGRNNELHGYMSDDYMSAEVLTGHALMVGLNNIGTDSIRKYWLLQPLIKNLADKEIESVEFDGKNILRLKIVWSDGTVIFVNQDCADWSLMLPDAEKDIVLPQYGFYAYNHEKYLLAAIRRINGGVVEHSQNGAIVYANARMNPKKTFLPILPEAGEFNIVGENEFTLPIRWNIYRSMKEHPNVKNYSWFLHLEEPQKHWHQKLLMTSLGGGQPAIPVKDWDKQHVTDTGILRVPAGFPSGTYNVLAGLYDQLGDGHRAGLLSHTSDSSRILLGKLRVEKQGEKILSITFSPASEGESPLELFDRLFPPEKTVASWRNGLQSEGAFRAEYRKNTLVITPLPTGSDIEIKVDLDAVGKPKEFPAGSTIADGILTLKIPSSEKSVRVVFE